MWKLNNKGWGFIPFLLILCLLFLVLLFISYLVNEFDENFPRAREVSTYQYYENIVK
jgi:hypothetical protein